MVLTIYLAAKIYPIRKADAINNLEMTSLVKIMKSITPISFQEPCLINNNIKYLILKLFQMVDRKFYCCKTVLPYIASL